MVNTSFKNVVEDLFGIFENETITDKGARVDEYFDMFRKSAEMAGERIDGEHLNELRDVSKREVIPVYDAFNERRNLILGKIKKRTKAFAYFPLVPAVGIEILAGIFTELRSLRLMTSVPLAVGGALAGVSCYFVNNFSDQKSAEAERAKFFGRMRSLEQKLDFEKRYGEFKEQSEGKVMDGEFKSLAEKYEFPEQFWRDYKIVLQMDQSEDNKLSNNDFVLKVPGNFRNFAKGHVIFDAKVKKNRMEDLFLRAHQYFLRKQGSAYMSQQVEKAE